MELGVILSASPLPLSSLVLRCNACSTMNLMKNNKREMNFRSLSTYPRG
jgi:hypothetical protein